MACGGRKNVEISVKYYSEDEVLKGHNDCSGLWPSGVRWILTFLVIPLLWTLLAGAFSQAVFVVQTAIQAITPSCSKER